MDKNKTPLRRAMRDGDIDALFRLLDNGADVNERGLFDETLLHEAITKLEGHPKLMEVVTELLRRGADPKLLTPEGGGPLFSAAIVRDPAIMRLLLEAGADPNKQYDGPETVYEWAEFHYRNDEYRLDLPEEPSAEDTASQDAWLLFLERLAKAYNKNPPDFLRVLRDYGAKTSTELEQQSANKAL